MSKVKSRVPNMAMAICVQAGQVPWIIGDPGTAKTDSMATLAKQLGLNFQQTILSQKMREDLAGIPVTSKAMIGGIERECVRFILPEETLRAMYEPTLWLFDEFNQCPVDVMAAAQTLLTKNLPNSYMVCVGNSPDRSTDGRELSPPVINRLCQLAWELPEDCIAAGWNNGFRDYPALDFPVLPENWRNEYLPHWGQLFAGMRKALPHLFDERSYPTDMDKATQPFPSTRSMTNAGITMAACDSVGAPSSVRAQLLAGFVGQAAATEVLTYIGYSDLPDPEAVLARPDLLVMPQNRLDLCRMVLSGVWKAIEENCTSERWEKAYDVLVQSYEQVPDIAMAAEGSLWKIKPAGYTPKYRGGAALEMRAARLAGVTA